MSYANPSNNPYSDYIVADNVDLSQAERNTIISWLNLKLIHNDEIITRLSRYANQGIIIQND